MQTEAKPKSELKCLVLTRKDGEGVSFFHQGENAPYMEIKVELCRGSIRLACRAGEETVIVRSELLGKETLRILGEPA